MLKNSNWDNSFGDNSNCGRYQIVRGKTEIVREKRFNCEKNSNCDQTQIAKCLVRNHSTTQQRDEPFAISWYFIYQSRESTLSTLVNKKVVFAMACFTSYFNKQGPTRHRPMAHSVVSRYLENYCSMIFRTWQICVFLSVNLKRSAMALKGGAKTMARLTSGPW